jgi:hypothetical protein
MSRRLTPFLFEVVYMDGRVERAIFYAPSRSKAEQMAAEWGRRMGLEVEPVDREQAA